MRTIANVFGMIVGGLAAMLEIALAAVFAISTARTSQSYAISTDRLTVAAPSDPSSIERWRWQVFSKMTDDDLKAFYAYFKSLPAKADEQP